MPFPTFPFPQVPVTVGKGPTGDETGERTGLRAGMLGAFA